MNNQTNFLATLVPVVFLLASGSAYAYVGPGAGVSAIGSVLALIAAVLLAIIGFLWYPMKRIFKNRRKSKNQNTANNVSENTAENNLSENNTAENNLSEKNVSENTSENKT